MEEEAAIVNGMHSTASNGDGAGFTANGLGGVTLKFDGATKRKRVTDLSSERQELGFICTATRHLLGQDPKACFKCLRTYSAHAAP